MAEFDIVVEQLTARMNREHKISGLTMAISLVIIGMATYGFIIDYFSRPKLSLETVILAGIGATLHLTSWVYAGFGRTTIEEIKLHKRKHLTAAPLHIVVRELDEPNTQFWN